MKTVEFLIDLIVLFYFKLLCKCVLYIGSIFTVEKINTFFLKTQGL